MDASSKPVRFAVFAPAALVLLALLGPAAAPAGAAGTIRALEGGDRKIDEPSNRTYAQPLSGALFEYTSSASKAADPASTGWTAFPSATNASGAATVDVAAGTYYVRERSVAAGFSSFGSVRSLHFDPNSNVPGTARPYVAKVRVDNGQVTEAYPNASASADPASWSSTAGGGSGSPFVNVRDNATFPRSCGANILMVLDRSGSIEPFKSTYRDAAKAFVDAHAGTPTQIGIVSFSAGANAVNSYQDGSGSAALTRAPLDLSAGGSVAALSSTIDSVYADPSGGTNWDRALQKAAQARGFSADASTGQTVNADVVVFITDGNPTARSTDGSDSGSGVDLIDLTAGMASANLVKSQQARAQSKLKLYALGVGSGVTADNLKAVSGPVRGEDYETPSVAQLVAELTELAARTCGARIFVRKRLAGNAADHADWGFSAGAGGASIGYLDGNRRTHATAGGAVETGVTLTQLPAGGREVTVTEDAAGQPLGEFRLDSVSCRSGSYGGPVVAPVASVPLGVKLSVQRGAAIYCTFTNAPAKPDLIVTKTPDDAAIDAGQDAVFTIVVANRGDGVARNVTLSDQLPAPGAGGWVVGQPSQGTCSVDAANLLTCTGLGDLAKGQSRTVEVKTGTSNEVCPAFDNPAATASAANHQPVSDGGRITCRKDAKITLVKQLAPAADGGRFDLKVGATTVAAGVGDGGQGSTFVDPGTHTVSEAAASGTDLASYDKSIACRRNGQPAESGSGHSLRVPAGYGDVIVCTITNTRLGPPQHPAIDIEKTGPATATVGATLPYTLTVTNRGDVSFAAQEVVVADPRCEAPPAGPGTGADQTPGTLDPGDAWTYTCVAQTAGQPAGTFVNTATVTAKDPSGRAVADSDDFPTVLIAAQQVLSQTAIVSGRAQLRGPSGCVRGPSKATVRGRRIARVTFYRDGKLIRTIVARPGQRKFAIALPAAERGGVHRVTARIVFETGSRTRARTLRLSYQRCRTQVARPRFTG